MRTITTIAFDADDTLWHNERNFKLTEARLAEVLADHAGPEHLTERLIAAERRNVHHYGYGAKSFTLSTIETALEVTAGKAPGSVIAEILAAGRDLMRHPVETFPGVAETLAELKGAYRLLVVTKGDLFDQERKLAQSGIDHLFDAVEIVSEKDAGTYARVFGRHGDGVNRAMMVGNSLKSDVLPALAAGAWAVHVPHALTWALEHAEEPAGHVRYRRIGQIGELAKLLATRSPG
ncbi:MAG: haloacid dehalogenase [Alphaproteobacteria bacterium]|nr:MAG: haloacid dehalogenase [Alphaproteobacteria bacterium]